MGFILRSKVLLPLEIDSSKKWHPATLFGSKGTANDSNAGKTYVANLYNESFEAVYSSLASLSSAIISQYCPTTRCWGYMSNPAAAASHQALQISRSPWTCAFLRHQMPESQPLSFIRHWPPDIGPMLSTSAWLFACAIWFDTRYQIRRHRFHILMKFTSAFQLYEV